MIFIRFIAIITIQTSIIDYMTIEGWKPGQPTSLRHCAAVLNEIRQLKPAAPGFLGLMIREKALTPAIFNGQTVALWGPSYYDQMDSRLRHSRIDFAISPESLNYSQIHTMTLLSVTSALQTVPNTKTFVEEERARTLKTDISYVIHKAGAMIANQPWDEKKINFYVELREIIVNSLKEKPYQTMENCLPSQSGKASTNLGFNFEIFSALFPNVNALIASNSSNLRNRLLPNEVTPLRYLDQIAPFLLNHLQDHPQLNNINIFDLLTELTILHSHPKKIIEQFQLLKQSGASTFNTASFLDLDKLRYSLAKKQKERVTYAVPKEGIDPRDFGFWADVGKTNMMREDFNRKEAFVISLEEIRDHPDDYHQYQMALLGKIAETLGKNRRDYIDYPAILLKYRSPNLVFLLDKEVEKRFLELLPYHAVPMHIQVGDTCIPLSKLNKHKSQEEYSVINDLSEFVNTKTVNGRRIPAYTIPGQCVFETIKSGAQIFLMHGSFRSKLRGDNVGDQFEQGKESTGKWQRDFDLMMLGGDHNPGVILNTVKRHFPSIPRLRIGSYTGKTMRGVEWGDVSMDNATDSLVQIVRAYKGRFPNESAENLIQALLSLTTDRSACMMLNIVGEDHSTANITAQMVDVFNGIDCLADYYTTKGKSGVKWKGENRMAIIPFSRADVFPSNEPIAVWQLLRIFAAICRSRNGGILLPIGYVLNQTREVNWNQLQFAADEVRTIIGRELNNIRYRFNQEKNEVLYDDFVKESLKALNDGLNTDMNATLIILAGKNVTDIKRGAIGLGFGRFYPNLNQLINANNGQFWNRVIEEARLRVVQKGNGLQTLAKIIISIPEYHNFIPNFKEGRVLEIQQLIEWLEYTS